MMSQEAFMQKVNEITAANTERSQQSANAMMKFQAEMSNTAHQREVEDLIKAGLNPMLSVNQGASTPNGAMAQVDMSGSSALAQWNSASAALQGALANAGAIIRSAELSYAAARDFPNTYAGIIDRMITGDGKTGSVVNIPKDEMGNVNWHQLFKDIALNNGFASWSAENGFKLNAKGIAAFLFSGLNPNQYKMIGNFINRFWRRYKYPGT